MTANLDTARQRLETTALAVARARQACNGEHKGADLERRLKAELDARAAHAEAIHNYAAAHMAAHRKETA